MADMRRNAPDTHPPPDDNDAPPPSLFSAGLPSIVAQGASSDGALDGARPDPSAPTLAVLAPASASTARRIERLTIADEQLRVVPIAPLKQRLPSAQKDVDDPTTPVDSQRSKRARDYTTLTTLSRLFAGDSTMPSSRTPSYTHATAATGAVPLPDHLFESGFLQGRHSDITIIAFGRRYNLHRLLLDRAPFFSTALSEPWIESRVRDVPLYPEDIDANITQAAFELALKKLYGRDISEELHTEAVGVFATACWLEMQDLIDTSIESILKHMTPDTLAPLIRLVTTNYYGRSGDRILESAKAMLSRNGWEMPLKCWDNMPGDIIREMVASDGFFVHSEWDRWVLTKRLLDRRLRQAAVEAGLIERGERRIPKAPDSLSLMAVRFDAVYRQNSLMVGQHGSDLHAQWLALYTNPDIERILVLLDEGIHYIHMEFEQLDFIRNARDLFGLPVMPDKVISNALWQQLALRQRVVNADESAQELGLSRSAPEPATTSSAAAGSVSKQKAPAQAIEDEADELDVESGSWEGNGKPRKFWIPSSDCNIVLGNGADPVVTTSNSFQRHASRLSATLQPEDVQWATDFASSPSTMANPHTRTDHPVRPISAGGGNAGQPKPIAYTDFPPFRFSAEFPNPRHLKEKKRVYSRTVAYAGSLWNIYIQKVRSARNVQLGVYLHRAKEREVDEPATGSGLSQHTSRSVDERIGQLEREMLLRNERRERRRANRAPPDQTLEEDASASGGDADGTLLSTGLSNPLFSGIRRRSNMNADQGRGSSDLDQFVTSPGAHGEGEPAFFPLTMGSASDDESDISDDDEPLSAYPNPSHISRRKSRTQTCTLPTYVDARPTIKTYFKIYSPSKGGRMLSIYESAPDRFNFSQSWGWKSSTLMLDEGALNGNEQGDQPTSQIVQEKKSGEGKLRFMVVIGNL